MEVKHIIGSTQIQGIKPINMKRCNCNRCRFRYRSFSKIFLDWKKNLLKEIKKIKRGYERWLKYEN